MVIKYNLLPGSRFHAIKLKWLSAILLGILFSVRVNANIDPTTKASILSSRWNSRKLSEFTISPNFTSDVNPNRPFYDISIVESSVCLLDRVEVQITPTSRSTIESPLGHLAVHLENSNDVLVTSLDEKLLSQDNDVELMIKCALNEYHCKAKVTEISAEIGSKELVLNFNEDTTEPDLSSTMKLLRTFHFDPPLIGSAIGIWENPKRLRVSIQANYLQDVLKFYNSGRKITFDVKPMDSSLKQNQTNIISFRFKDPGDNHIFIYDSQNLTLISKVIKITSRHCDAAVLSQYDGNIMNLLTTDQSTQSDTEIVSQPKPAIRMHGTIAITGKQEVLIPQDSVFGMAKGTWSMSMWVFLAEGWNNKFRSFFYKGDISNGTQRTPSAWFLPNNNRLTLRATSEDSADIGAESIQDIPIGKWTLLTFTFINVSDIIQSQNLDTTDIPVDNKHDVVFNDGLGREFTVNEMQKKKWENVRLRLSKYINNKVEHNTKYIMNLYINGEMDLTIQYSTLILGNTHPLHMFSDGTHPASLGFVNDLTFWTSALSVNDIKSLYMRGPEMTIEGIDQFVSLLKPTQLYDGNFYKQRYSNFGVSPFQLPYLAQQSASSLLVAPKIDDLTQESSATVLLSIPVDIEPTSVEISENSQLLLQKAREATQNCEDYDSRLDRYAEAAHAGSVNALFTWAMLTLFGSESSDNKCGLKGVTEKLHSTNCLDMSSSDKAVIALLLSLEMGSKEAIPIVSTLILSGIGLKAFQFLANASIDDFAEIKSCVPMAFFQVEIYGTNEIYSSAFHKRFAQTVVANIPRKQNLQGVRSSLPVSKGYSVFDISDGSIDYHLSTDLAIGMLHVAALYNNHDAQSILGYKYQNGYGVPKDVECALFYANLASAYASQEFHRVGGQSVVEADRINDKTEKDVEIGQRGHDDELIQGQIVRANEGDVQAMLNTADLYYFGARGLPRDQPRALGYFERAAQQGNIDGMCGAAAMYLKGEGTDKNVTRATELYEEAASYGSVKALNGLGYMYFFGQSVEKNETKAFYYFLAAAETETDGSSLFNAGFCLEKGLGVPRDVARAVKFYQLAARKFGYLDAIRSLGVLLMEGIDLPRDSKEALVFLSAAKEIGPWVGWIRRGLDQYLSQEYYRAMVCYILAGEHGFEVSQSNSAFIIRRKLRQSMKFTPDMLWNQPTMLLEPRSSGDMSNDMHLKILELRQLLLSASHQNSRSVFFLGLSFLSDHPLPRDMTTALWWLSKASAMGNGLASMYLGIIHMFSMDVDQNLARAQRYLKYALDSTDVDLDANFRHIIRGLLWYLDSGQKYMLARNMLPYVEQMIRTFFIPKPSN